KLATSSKKVFKPPIPEPQITPIRLVSSLSNAKPASFTASSVEAIAYCTKGSTLRASLRSINSCGSNPFTSQANWVLNFAGSKCVRGAAPLTPLITASQYAATVLPSGVRAPNPVTTTLLSSIKYVWPNKLVINVLFQVRDSLTYCTDVFSLIVWNIYVKFFFEFHDQLNCVKLVCT